MAKVIRKGVRVRYAGNDLRDAELWGDRVYTVIKKSGNMAVGYFPMLYCDGTIHLCRYSVRTSDLEIVE